MGKPVGSPKTGGRKKGTPNKRIMGFYEALLVRGIDPLDEILKEVQRLSGADKIEVFLDLLPYIYSKRKPTEPEKPFSIKEYIESMSFSEMEGLHVTLEKLLGYNKPHRDLTLEQLEAQKETLEELIALQELNEALTEPDIVTDSRRRSRK